MTVLRIHEIWNGRCPLLGPSLYVWVQGCPRRCPGCFNQEALAEDGPARESLPEEVAASWQPGDGLVFSGGEPFSQARGLVEVCALVRSVASDAPILVYTGYRLEELLAQEREDWLALLKQIDVLVDGPYVQERQTNMPLVGSDNQRVYFLTSRVQPSQVLDHAAAQLQVSLTADHRLRLVGTGGPQGLNMHQLVEKIRAQGLSLEE